MWFLNSHPYKELAPQNVQNSPPYVEEKIMVSQSGELAIIQMLQHELPKTTFGSSIAWWFVCNMSYPGNTNHRNPHAMVSYCVVAARCVWSIYRGMMDFSSRFLHDVLWMCSGTWVKHLGRNAKLWEQNSVVVSSNIPVAINMSDGAWRRANRKSWSRKLNQGRTNRRNTG